MPQMEVLKPFPSNSFRQSAIQDAQRENLAFYKAITNFFVG